MIEGAGMQRYDLLFVKGKSLQSKVIQAVTDSPYSHVAIVLDSYHVLETDVRYPLQIRHLSYPVSMYDVYRFHRELTENEKARMEAFIKDKLQTKYDLARTITNGLFVIAKIPIMNAMQRMNCTEAAYELYKAGGMDLEANLTPKELATSKKLIKIQRGRDVPLFT